MKTSPKQPSATRALALAGLIAAATPAMAISACRCSDNAKPQATSEQEPKGLTSKFTGKKFVFLAIVPHAHSADSAAKWFQEETGAVVEVRTVNYDEYRTTIVQDQVSGAPQIDVFEMFYVDLAPLVSQGVVMELTSFIDQNKATIRPEDFVPGIYDNYTLYDNKRWALPWDGDTHVLFYRKSLLAKHGIKPPETWGDYLNAAKTITEKERSKGVYGAAIMAFPAPILIISSYMNRLASFGGELLDPQNRPTVNSPEGLMALEAMVEHGKHALPTPIETDFDASRSAFLSGRVAMVEQWTDIGIMAEDPTQSRIRGDWGAVPMPKGSGPKGRRASALNAGFGVAVARTTKEPELSREFVRFVSRPDTLLRLNLMVGGLDPARQSILQSADYKRFAPEISAIAQISLLQTVPWPRVPQAANLTDALAKSLAKAMEGLLTPKAALDEAQARWVDILRQGGAAQ